MKKKAVIIGAGPAGLTAAYELLKRTDIHPIVIEQDGEVGGISRTVNFKGNRIDVGGHRFFSKSDRIMDWWLNILPLEESASGSFAIHYQNKQKTIIAEESDPTPNSYPYSEDRVMLVRKRKSRIYFQRKFFDYPVRLNLRTVRNLGLARMVKIGFSYLKSAFLPIRPERNLEEFFINRFGRELYETFFHSYTEKVWGVPCREITAEWGAQRIRGLSIGKALLHTVTNLFRGKGNIAQKGTETSLIEQFLYPRLGPGQMWEAVADKVREMGGEILTGYRATRLLTEGNRIRAVAAVSQLSGVVREFNADYVFSTMPVQGLIRAMGQAVPKSVRHISEGLQYRDFLTVGLLLKNMQVKDKKGGLISDNWIYIQDPDVSLGRVQIFNNWSPFMVRNPEYVWVGLEYFCNEGDKLWEMADSELIRLGREELAKVGMASGDAFVDGVVVRMPKAYPAYFGTYPQFGQIREYLDPFENLLLVGRNGMHRYNNQDHSMLTAMTAVDNIVEGRKDRENIWAVNTEEDYHERLEQPNVK
ncbi:MAG: NAD(P)/FAD-dependent oxidoreductase [Acidobacteria bacterium]|nr:NAD(P)/FAD-dependent oxidoreductase [Acidobacteriota bacterium]